MTDVIFNKVKIIPDSYENGAPGVWWPSAHLEDAASGDEFEDVRLQQNCRTKAEADAAALEEAKQRIRRGEHR